MENKGLLIVFGILIAVVATAGVYVFLAGGEKPGPLPNTAVSPTPVQTTPEPTGAPISVLEVLELEVSGGEYNFNPASLTINKGERVKLTFKNEGRLPHNLTIDELGFATDTIAGGKTTTAEFTAEKSGTFAMYCSVGTHRQQGMEGRVQVK